MKLFISQAAAAVQGKQDFEKPVVEAPTIHHIRITLTGRNIRVLEKVCADLINGAKKQKLRVKVSVVGSFILIIKRLHFPGGLTIVRPFNIVCPS